MIRDLNPDFRLVAQYRVESDGEFLYIALQKNISGQFESINGMRFEAAYGEIYTPQEYPNSVKGAMDYAEENFRNEYEIISENRKKIRGENSLSIAGIKRKFAGKSFCPHCSPFPPPLHDGEPQHFPNPKKDTKSRKKNLDMMIVNPENEMKELEIIGIIPGQIERIEYRRTGKYPGGYQHTFQNDSQMYALSDGSLLIRPKDGHENLFLKANPQKKSKNRRKKK